MKLASYAITHVGKLRSVNEDAYCADAERGLFAVADGMGGRAGGEVASRLAVKKLVRCFANRAQSLPVQSWTALLRRAFKDGNDAIKDKGEKYPELQGMGTTMTTCLMRNSKAYFAHIGDSRAYLVRGDTLSQLTRDHTLAEMLIEEGRITEAQAARHPKGKMLMCVLGTTAEPEIDFFEHNVQVGDVFLLATDGLIGGLADETILHECRRVTPLSQRCERLVNRAVGADGKDNVTVVLVEVREQVAKSPGLRSAGQSASGETPQE